MTNTIIAIASGTILLFNYFVLSSIINKRQPKIKNEIRKTDDIDANTMTLGGFGSRFYGHFRKYQGTYVTYQMICVLFLPLFPVRCFRIRKIGKPSFEFLGPETKYECYGELEKFNGLEILSIYFTWYGWIFFIISLFSIFT